MKGLGFYPNCCKKHAEGSNPSIITTFIFTMSSTNIYSNNYPIISTTGNTSSSPQLGNIGIGHPVLTTSIFKEENTLNFKLIPAIGGFILEVYKSSDILTGYMPPVNRYILRERNMGKQIEKILAIEILKR